MTVGVLLVTHDAIGKSLRDAIQQIIGEPLPLPVKTLAVLPEMKPDWICEKLHHLCDDLNQGQGVLILTDLYGATPSNSVCELRRETYPIKIISGLNLSMLVKVVNYASLDLESLAKKASEGAHEGIVSSDAKLPD